MAPSFPVAATLDDAYAACDFETPLQSDDPRYVDLSAARGDNTTQFVKARLMKRQAGRFAKLAFLSHRGAGKTTELLRITDDLKHHFAAYYFEANVRLDARHITTEDLLLVLVLGLEEHFRAEKMPLPAGLIDEVHQWFAEIARTTSWGTKLSGELKSEAGVGGEVPFFAKLKTELMALIRTESEYRKELRDAFRRYPGTLLANVNRVLDAANERLKAEGSGRELIIVIDNLDRYDPRVVDDLLIKGGRMLQELRCHLIVTPPISLHYKPVSEKLDAYFHPEFMNTVRLRSKDQPYDAFDAGPGRRLMLEALGKRMDVARLIPDTHAQDRLVSASGGAIRDLLRLVSDAILLASGGAIDLGCVEKAVQRTRVGMRDMINANGWAAVLARVALDHQPHDEPACMDVLFQRLVLKYNGEGWYDLHPLAAEVPEVQKAIEALRRERAPKGYVVS